MNKQSILLKIRQLHRPVFTTHELSMFSGRSLSNTTQILNLLEKKGLIFKIARGIWAEAEDSRLSPYIVIPFLFSKHRAYVSFTSALHLHGIIEQIPQAVTLASTVHTKVVHTKTGAYFIHKISPSLFNGFNWYRGSGDFLIAEPEKALFDCLYLSAKKKKQFSHFPELHFSKSFSFKKVKKWAGKISNPRIRVSVMKKITELERKYGQLLGV